jgi:oxygen-independent coproporphyrinogen III oxidase
MSGIYIHIPFCKQACSYCDFYFVTRQELREKFVSRLCLEIDQFEDSVYAGEPVKTVYLGGGTPSLLNIKELERIFSHLHSVFRLKPEEITMELNPDDVSVEYLKGLHSIGIDRASMGVQSFDAGRLKFMNRVHTPEEARFALEALSKAGFKTFTVDLIYGNPGQKTDDLENDIDNLLQFEPPHVSAYALTIEPRTRIGKQVELGRLEPAPDELVSVHFNLLNEKLKSKGINRYEVSNFSRPGYEAVHNTRYWQHENYLGLGPSAHNFWWDENGALRWKSKSDIGEYIQKPFKENYIEKENLNWFLLAEERIMLGLRTRWGVTVDELLQKYGYKLSNKQQDWLTRKQNEGVLDYDGSAIALTDKGIRIADHLIVELLTRN